MRGYFAQPARPTGKLPGVLVVHENRGLNPHIEDIARRLAVENFVAFAPDALTPLGGYPGDEDKARELFPKLDQAKTREDFVAAAAFLKARPECTGKRRRGGLLLRRRHREHARDARARISAPPCRSTAAQPDAADVPKIKAPLLIHYAENDERINAGLARITKRRSRRTRSTYTAYIYPGTQHGFNNDTTPRYDEAAAKLAWQRTVEFFNKHLR